MNPIKVIENGITAIIPISDQEAADYIRCRSKGKISRILGKCDGCSLKDKTLKHEHVCTWSEMERLMVMGNE